VEAQTSASVLAVLRELPPSTERKPYERSPLLLAAYCTIGVTLALLVFGPGMYWILGSAAMAVLLALAELVVQLRRRRRA
jgi:hypothetical protein